MMMLGDDDDDAIMGRPRKSSVMMMLGDNDDRLETALFQILRDSRCVMMI